MTKLVQNDIASLTNEQSALAALNANYASNEAFSDTVLSRDGTVPNEMLADLDMNSSRIVNLPAPISQTEPLRLKDLTDFVGGSLSFTNGSTDFLGLLDTPNSYATHANELVKVNPGATALVFGGLGTGVSTDNAVVRWDGTNQIQNSGVSIDDSNNITGIVNETTTGYKDFTEIATPAIPVANKLRIYSKAVGTETHLFSLSDAGVETNITDPALSFVVRDRLTAIRTYFVSTTGSDSNTGLTALVPFATLQKAWDTIANNIDLAGFRVNIQLADGTYTNNPIRGRGAGVGVAATGSAEVWLVGNTATPANVIVTATDNFCVRMQDGAKIFVTGMELRTSSSGYCFSASSGGVIYTDIGVRFGVSADGHVQANRSGTVILLANYDIVGGATFHFDAYQSGVILLTGTATLTGTPTFTTFAYAHRNGTIDCELGVFSGGANGQRFKAEYEGCFRMASSSLTLFPGSTVGVISDGGNYHGLTAVTFTNTGLQIRDTDASHNLIIVPGSNITANRNLTLTTGDAARTVTLNGDPTLNDWFDQSVKVAANPQFNTIEVGAASDTTLSRASAGNLNVEGNLIYRAGGTDVPVTDGGTGASDATNARINLGVGTALLATGSAAGATLDLVLTAYTAYRGLTIKLYNFVPATDGANLLMRFSTNGGGAYDAAAGNYHWAYNVTLESGATAGVGSAAATEIEMIQGVGNATTEGANVSVEILNQTSTAQFSRARFTVDAMDNAATSQVKITVGTGARVAAQDTDAIRFLFSAGNISTGTYAIYGYH